MAVTKLDGVAVQIEEVTAEVNFRKVESSNVKMVGWDNARNLYVVFKGNGLYAYLDVSRQRAVAMAYSASVGSYFHRKIKNKFRGVQVGYL